MKIDLSKGDVEMIDKALQAWESSAFSDGAITAIMTSMFSRGENEIQRKSAIEEIRREARQQSEKRRRDATMLRAKLFQAENAASEHEVT